MEFLPEWLRLQNGASTEQRRMERPFRARFLHGGPVLARMMITVMTIVIVAIVARFHRGGSWGNRIRRMNRQNGLHRMTGTARSLYSSGALQTGFHLLHGRRYSEQMLLLLLLLLLVMMMMMMVIMMRRPLLVAAIIGGDFAPLLVMLRLHRQIGGHRWMSIITISIDYVTERYKLST